MYSYTPVGQLLGANWFTLSSFIIKSTQSFNQSIPAFHSSTICDWRVDIIFNNTPTGLESDHNYNILGFHIPVSVVVETPEVVPKPCNLFFIGQLWVAAPPWGAPSMFIPAGAAVTTCSSQDQHLSLAGYLLLNHS